MSSLTVASWAESGVIKRDTLDICLFEVRKNGYTFTYSVDMRNGLIIASIAFPPDSSGSSSHRYLYGEHNGIHYLRRVCSFPDSNTDTTIRNGGFDFYNIRINDKPVAPVINLPRARKSGPTMRFMEINGMGTLFVRDNQPARIEAFDLAGRRRFSQVAGKGSGTVRLDQTVFSVSGGYIVSVRTKGSDAFPAFTVR